MYIQNNPENRTTVFCIQYKVQASYSLIKKDDRTIYNAFNFLMFNAKSESSRYLLTLNLEYISVKLVSNEKNIHVKSYSGTPFKKHLC